MNYYFVVGIPFQFHNGSIKSTRRIHFHVFWLFQFHIGTIKSQGSAEEIISSLKFQFHNGSIKSYCEDEQMRVTAMFQFHNGAIKSYISNIYLYCDRRVSIPLWFD